MDYQAEKDKLLRSLEHLRAEELLPLPEDPQRYFLLDVPGTVLLPLEQLEASHVRPAGIANALKLMYSAAQGTNPLGKRKPISVEAIGNGRFRVREGNSTFAVAQQSGWKVIPALVEEPGQRTPPAG